MKVILVDGPHHGHTLYIEGDPPNRIYMPAILFTARVHKRDELAKPLTDYTHSYVGITVTYSKTLVYEYRGQD